MPFWNEKVAVVTGGSQGLGLAIARALANAGARVIITARKEQQLATAAQSLSSHGRQCGWLPADVTQADQVKTLVTQVMDKHGRLDAVINCAGKSDRGDIASLTAAKLRELLELNFLAAVTMTQTALPHLLATRGHAVFLGSLASKSASRYLGAYPASKFPLAAYAQQLRLELGLQGLHSLLVCPGPIARPDAGVRYDSEASNLPVSARQPGGGIKLRGIDAARLARRILLACERREAELIVPARAKLLFALAQLSPALGDWLLTRFTSRS